jgi:UDP-N-acetylmuramoyl-tripeptide--D-alanyl-D-alanine ligase
MATNIPVTTEKLYQLFRKFPVVTTDSRKIPARSMFFALKGENFDGNRFAGQALEQGAAIAIVDDPAVVKDHRYMVVDDVLRSLQQLARFHRNRMNIPVIGITGSNGKTTTKELIHAVLSRKYQTLATHGNLNNHIGVPLTLLSITTNTQIAVVEMGANHVGEIAFLCELARPTHGLITNMV